MNLLNRVLPAAMLLAALSNPVIAEPGKITTYLMNEPVSVLEFGLYLIDLRLNKFPMHPEINTTTAVSFSSVAHNREKDRITIDFIGWLKPGSAKSTKTVCAEIINNLRGYLGVEPTTGELVEDGYLLLRYFQRGGSSIQNPPPENLAKGLADLILLRSNVTLRTGGESTSCEAPLLGTEVL